MVTFSELFSSLHYYLPLPTCRVDALVMRQLKIDSFKMIALKIQAVSHNTTHPIIVDSALLVSNYSLCNTILLLIFITFIYYCYDRYIVLVLRPCE